MRYAFHMRYDNSASYHNLRKGQYIAAILLIQYALCVSYAFHMRYDDSASYHNLRKGQYIAADDSDNEQPVINSVYVPIISIPFFFFLI